MATRGAVSAGTRVPGSGSASTAPHPVGCPIPNFEAGELYCSVSSKELRAWGILSAIQYTYVHAQH